MRLISFHREVNKVQDVKDETKLSFNGESDIYVLVASSPSDMNSKYEFKFPT